MKRRSKIIAIILFCMIFMTGCVSDVKDNLKGYSLKEDVDLYLEEAGFTGTIMLGKNHEIYYLNSMGSIGYDKEEDIKPRAVMEIGSVTKQMTAAAVLKLCDQDKMGLEDTLDKYFPAYSYGDKITVRNLINMNSGIQDYLTDDRFLEGYPEPVDETVLEYIFAYDWNESSLGTYEYSNSNYFLLGKIIEIVSGMTYEEYMKENFFAEIGMLDTELGICETIEPISYSGATSYPADFTWSAGGMVSNVYDLLQWEKAYWNGEVIAEEHLSEIRSSQNEYIYGWYHNESGFFHTGHTKAFKTFVYVDAETGMEVILLTNNSELNVEEIALEALECGRKYMN